MFYDHTDHPSHNMPPSATITNDGETMTVDGFNGVSEWTVEELQDQLFEGVCDGVCTHCGSGYGPVEPDARGYSCDECGTDSVMSVLELFMFGAD